MKSKERRELILKLLFDSDKPIKGIDLAKEYNVTRQIIVKDIAILREKNNIIATPDGYMLNNIIGSKIRKIIAVSHTEDDTIRELEVVVKYGGTIEDVIVEHPIYGEIKGNLMIKNLNDLNKFTSRFVEKDVKPLSALTNGTHLHTIAVETEEDMNEIKRELKELGYLL